MTVRYPHAFALYINITNKHDSVTGSNNVEVLSVGFMIVVVVVVLFVAIYQKKK